MRGDFSRFSYDSSKHYTGVLKQQGRVDLDADWNEYVEIQDHLRRAMERDLMGGSGVPDQAGGFKISWDTGKKDLIISRDDSADPTRPSCIYVDSILCELEGERRYGSNPHPDNQPHLPSPDSLNLTPGANGRIDLVYLDVWQRHVTAIEDPDIREEALAGPDTTTRLQTVWQVKVWQTKPGSLPAACSPEVLPQDWPPPQLGGGQLSTRGSYRGSENRLYRVEIHRGGKAAASSGNYATFKWSRDNGTVVFPAEKPPTDKPIDPLQMNKVRVSRLGRDQTLALREGDWVEVGGDESELKGKLGLITRIKEDGIDRTRLELTLESQEAASYAQQDHPKVRRWDQTEAGDFTFDPKQMGECKVQDALGKWVELEDGVQIRFEPGNPDYVYRTGDYWIFAVRAATSRVEELVKAHPRGVRHHYCPLALVKWSVSAASTTAEIRDCRVRFGSLSGQLATVESFFYLGGDGQVALPSNEVLQPLRVGLTKGGQPVDNRQIRFTIEEGAGKLKKVGSSPVPPYESLTVTTQGGVAECAWELGTATQAQKVRATVVGGSQAPIIFMANASLGWHVPDKPFAGTKVDGPVVFGRSGGALGSSYPGQELAVRWDTLRNVRVGRAPTHPPIFVSRWGSFGSGDGQFDQPVGIAVDSSGNVFVSDTGNHRIQKFNSNGAFLTKWGSRGTGNGQFEHPEGIAVDSSGNVYVGDQETRIQKFNSNGTFITRWGSYGGQEGQFDTIAGVAVDAQGNVYVADMGSSASPPRIHKFNSNGTFLTRWGSRGTGDGQFLQPIGVAVDSSGNVYVVDTGWPQFLPRIHKFTSDGTFLAKWGSPGSGDGQLSYPSGVAVDSYGNVYVSERDNHRIQKFTSDGTFLTSWGSQGTGDGQFGSPSDVAVDPSGNAYVLDRFTNWPRVQKFVETRGNLSIEGNLLARNAGIGTTNPERWRLTIQGGERISFKDTTGATKWHINDWNGSALGSGDFNIAETGVADGRLYLKAGGNVGIGTTAPAAKLTIAGGGDLLFRASSEIPNDPGDVVFQTFTGSQKGRIWSNPGAGAALFLSSGDNTPRIAIGSDGKTRISSGLTFPKTSDGDAELTNWTGGNIFDDPAGTVRLRMGHQPLNGAVPTYGFQVGHSGEFPFFGGVLSSFAARFSVNQNGDAEVARNLRVFGNISATGTISGNSAKTGYVADNFINGVGDTLEQGDVLVIGSTDTSHYSGKDNNIPLIKADLTVTAYDSRVCGIVASVVTENELPYVEETQAPSLEDVARGANATEAAVRKAVELGVNPFEVEGTGSGGRVLVADIETAVEEGEVSSTSGLKQAELGAYLNPLAQFAGEITPESDTTKIEDQQMGRMVTLGAFAHCKVDAEVAPISAGDLLTTSPTKGHAQKVLEPEKAAGAIVGKALASLDRGKGKIPVLVMLQ